MYFENICLKTYTDFENVYDTKGNFFNWTTQVIRIS